MASDSWAKELNKDLTDTLHDWMIDHTTVTDEDREAIHAELSSLLERRLLPLLEAGQTMRELPFTDGLARAWDAAKTAALKEPTDGER